MLIFTHCGFAPWEGGGVGGLLAVADTSARCHSTAHARTQTELDGALCVPEGKARRAVMGSKCVPKWSKTWTPSKSLLEPEPVFKTHHARILGSSSFVSFRRLNFTT